MSRPSPGASFRCLHAAIVDNPLTQLSDEQLQQLCSAVMQEQNRRIELRLDLQAALNYRLNKSILAPRN